jgi:hypothetical protein
VRPVSLVLILDALYPGQLARGSELSRVARVLADTTEATSRKTNRTKAILT